jgi:transposase
VEKCLTIKGMTANDINLPTEAEVRAAYHEGEEAVVELFRHMNETIIQLVGRIQTLENQIAKNSSNSSKPPSSDGYRKPSPKSLRQRHKKKSGGQPGHIGKTLQMVSEPDRVEVYRVSRCRHCQASLDQVALESVEKRQIFDIPPMKMEVTEYQADIKRCPQCGERTKADFPAGIVQTVGYGPEFKARIAYWSQYQLIPLERVCEMAEDLYGHRPSEATVLEISREGAAQVEPVRSIIHEHLKQQGPVRHFDETGMRVEGKLHWLHSVSTALVALYAVHAQRGQQAMEAMGILPVMKGIAMHDCWQPYFRYPDITHALCNAHLLRELVFVKEQYHQSWAVKMIDLLLEIKKALEGQQGKSNALPAYQAQKFEQRYAKLIRNGLRANPASKVPEGEVRKRGRTRQSVPRNLVLRLKLHKKAVLLFMWDFQVPFDNNQAERDIRMMKVKQKISGGFRSWNGAEVFCLLRGYISTARKNGVGALESLRLAFNGKPFLPDFLAFEG